MKKLTLEKAKELFPSGTRVRWTAHFLRSIGDYSYDSARRTGTVEGEVKSYDKHFHTVQVRWDDTPGELSGVNCSNLVALNRIHLEPA